MISPAVFFGSSMFFQVLPCSSFLCAEVRLVREDAGSAGHTEEIYREDFSVLMAKELGTCCGPQHRLGTHLTTVVPEVVLTLVTNLKHS